MDTMIYRFIAKEISERLEHEAKTAKILHCTEVGIFFGDFYEDCDCSTTQYILGTTWTDFFEDVWEKNRVYSFVYPDIIGNEMHFFVRNLCIAAERNVDVLLPCIYTELFRADFSCFMCTVIDSEKGKLRINAMID